MQEGIQEGGWGCVELETGRGLSDCGGRVKVTTTLGRYHSSRRGGRRRRRRRRRRGRGQLRTAPRLTCRQ